MIRIKSVLILFIMGCFSDVYAIKIKRAPLKANRFEALSGTSKDSDFSLKEKLTWDKKYSKNHYIYGKAPAEFLANSYKFIPEGSKVLDMGMGEGRNAVFLAQMGYQVTGIDISSVAVKKAKLLAKEFSVRINTIVASLKEYSFPSNSFDAIICYYYVDRELNKKIQDWLRPGGVLIYEAYTYAQRKKSGHKGHKKEHLLAPGELLRMFPSMTVLKYEEPQHEKNYRASVILKKTNKLL